ncbi:MAG: PKD domain-containing protein [Bacteriovorax sp.]|jgi:PKD repeat protein
MKSLLSALVLLSLVFSTGALADNREGEHGKDKGHKGHKEEHSKDKDQKTFTVDKTEGSGPLVVTFDASRIHSAKKYYFNFGNGETLVTRSPIITYSYKRAGIFTASLQYSVKNKDHDRDEGRHDDKHKDNGKDDELKNLKDGGSVVINVINTAPTGDLYADKIKGVIPLSIDFQARNLLDADGDIASVAWNFGDGSTTSGANVSHTFTIVGSFDVSLTITDNLGAVTTKSVKITTLEPLREVPIVAFKYFEDGSTVIDLRSGPVKTQFELERVFYTIDGTQTVPVADFYPGTRTLVDLKTYGTHTITITVFDIRGQTASETHIVNLLEDPSTLKPVVDFRTTPSSVRTIFFNFNRAFNPDSLFTIKNYHIDYGDGTSADITDDIYATHTYLNSGTYTATLTVTTGQNTKATASRTFTVTDLDVPIVSPVAAFGYQINSWAQNVSFYNERSGTPNGEIISYLWDFGDGSSGTGNRVAHFYEPGSYLVTLTVTDTAGLRNSQTQNVIIYQEGSDLVANIDCGTSTAQTQVCTITALDKFNEINSVRVLWGDGTSSMLTTLAVPGQGIYKATKKFLTNGMQTISLYVSTIRGEAKTATITKEVLLPSPVAKINCSIINLKLNCNTGSSFDPSGAGIASYTYDFGNGAHAVSADGVISYSYPNAGTYNVTLTIKSNSGLSSSATTQVTAIQLPPIAKIACTVVNLTISCNSNGSLDPSGLSILSYSYDFGDGTNSSPSSQGFAQHSYTAAGSYPVKIIVKSESGLTSTATTQVTVNYAPPLTYISRFSSNLLVSCNSFGSFDPQGFPVSFEFDYGDSFTESSTSGISSHVYSESGLYTVVVKVISSSGLSSLATAQVQPLKAPNVLPVGVLSCVSPMPLQVQCNANGSTDSDGQIISYKFEFDDNTSMTTGSLNPITHSFAQSGMTTVTLIVTDNEGGSSTVSIDVFVNEFPAFDIEISSAYGPIPLEVTFNLVNIDPSFGNIQKVEWSFGDSGAFDGFTPMHVFNSVGKFLVKAKATYTNGLVVTQQTNISTYSQSNIIIDADKDSGEAPLLVHLDASKSTDPVSSIVKYEWFYLGKKIGEGAEVDVLLQNTGIQTATLVVTNNEGQTTSGSKEILVSVPPIYIEDNFSISAVVGEEYRGEIIISHTESIPDENIRLEFENLPEGFLYNQVSRSFSWTPSAMQKGINNFKIIATDGIISTERIVEINVMTVQIIASYEVPASGGIITVDDPGTIFDKAIISLPGNATTYSASLARYDTGEGYQFEVISNVKGVFNYDFNEDVGTSYERMLTDHLGSLSNPSSNTIIRNGKKCMTSSGKISHSEGATFSEINQNNPRPNFIKAGHKNSITFIYGPFSDVSTAEYYNKIIDEIRKDINFLNKFNGPFNVYLKSAMTSFAGGETNINILDKAIVFIPSSENHFDVLVADTKRAVLHEYFHTIQNAALNCMRPYIPKSRSYNSVFEGSAEQFAFSHLNNVEQMKILKKEYSVRPNINSPLALAALIAKNGIFNYDGDASNYRDPIPFKPYGQYNTWLIWDFFSSLNFFTYLGKKFQTTEDIAKAMGDDKKGGPEASVEFINHFFPKNEPGGLDIALGLYMASFYKDEDTLYNFNGSGTSDKLWNTTFKTNEFSASWNNLSIQELYQKEFKSPTNPKGSIDYKIISGTNLNAGVKEDQFKGYNLAANEIFAPLSAERRVFSVPKVLDGFNTQYYPLYFIADRGGNNFSYSINHKYIWSTHGNFGKFLEQAELPILLNDEELGKINISPLDNMYTFTLDIINHTSKPVVADILLRPACQVVPNVSGYYNNKLPYYPSKTDAVDHEHGIRISCGNRKCQFIARLCSNDFDPSLSNVFSGSDKNCPGYIYDINNRGNDGTSVGNPAQVADEGTMFVPEIYGSSEFNSKWLFSSYIDEYSIVQQNAKLFTGKLIVCQVGGGYDLDLKLGEKNITITPNQHW